MLHDGEFSDLLDALPDDLTRVNMAFFTLNGVISVFVFLGIWADLYLGSPWMFQR